MYSLEDAAKVLPKRFMEKIKVAENGCWEWIGSLDGPGDEHGYGAFHVPGTTSRVIRAHLFAYKTVVGPIPQGLEIDHLCRNHSCVNPNHLEPVAHQVNVLRGLVPIVNGQNQREKTHCPKGHPYDSSNTLVRKNGSRDCLTCKRINNRIWMQGYRERQRRRNV